jgi:hypothetical protein
MTFHSSSVALIFVFTLSKSVASLGKTGASLPGECEADRASAFSRRAERCAPPFSGVCPKADAAKTTEKLAPNITCKVVDTN